jgi:transposase InsO family protein
VEAVRFVPWVSERCEHPQRWVCDRLGLVWSRYQRWRQRSAAGAELEDGHGGGERLDRPLGWEVQAVIDFALAHPADGYRRLTWMMVDQCVACLSESAVYRILAAHDLLYRWARPARRHGQKPAPPTAPHQRWHTDLMYLRIGDSWYFLASFLDAYSRYIVHWELLTQMTADDVVEAQRRALARYPGIHPEVVTDRGSQYTSAEYKKLIRECELRHILCRVAHPQSNGLIERFHRSSRDQLDTCDLPTFRHAQDALAAWVDEYNERRLHAGLHYLEPATYFRGNPEARLATRKARLEDAAKVRRQTNQAAADQPVPDVTAFTELPTGHAPAPTSMVAHSRGAVTYG